MHRFRFARLVPLRARVRLERGGWYGRRRFRSCRRFGDGFRRKTCDNRRRCCRSRPGRIRGWRRIGKWWRWCGWHRWRPVGQRGADPSWGWTQPRRWRIQPRRWRIQPRRWRIQPRRWRSGSRRRRTWRRGQSRQRECECWGRRFGRCSRERRRACSKDGARVLAASF